MKLTNFFYNLFDGESKACKKATNTAINILGAIGLFIALLVLWQILASI